jgi:hypothetical protein
MFKCKLCSEKDKLIEYLKAQNKDLQDRILAFAKEAFVYYKAEQKNQEPLFPVGVDEKGELFNYKGVDLEKQKEEIMRAYGEESYAVEEQVEKILEG